MAKAILFLFILLLAAPASLAEPMVIDEEVRCVGGEMTVEGDVTILAGGRLYLEDCTFKIDTPPYKNGWLNVGVEGSLLKVEPGGVLEIRSVTRNTTLAPATTGYGYTLDVAGELLIAGSREHAVEIHGLEGYMAEAFIGGGITVRGPGRAEAHNVSYHLIYGPAMFAVDGAHVDVRDVEVVRASGAFGATNATLVIHRGFANMGIEAIRASRATLEVHDSEFLAGRVSVHATRSDVLVRNTTLAAANVALQLSDSSADVSGSKLRYGIVGLVHEHKPERGLHSRILLTDSVLEAFMDRPESMAVVVDGADVTITSSTLRNYTSGGINLNAGSVRLDSIQFEGNGSFHAFVRDPVALEADGHVVRGTAVEAFVYSKDVRVEVVRSGVPLANATVEALGTSALTDANGTVEFVWKLPVDAAGRPDMDDIKVRVAAPGDSRTVSLSFSDTRLLVDLDQAVERGSPGPGFVFLLLAFAAALVLRRR